MSTEHAATYHPVRRRRPSRSCVKKFKEIYTSVLHNTSQIQIHINESYKSLTLSLLPDAYIRRGNSHSVRLGSEGWVEWWLWLRGRGRCPPPVAIRAARIAGRSPCLIPVFSLIPFGPRFCDCIFHRWNIAAVPSAVEGVGACGLANAVG